MKAFFRYGALAFWAGGANLALVQCNQPQPALAAQPTGADSGLKAAPAAEAVAALHREWILQGWEWQAGNGPFSSLVWRATNKGWKIVREHNSSVVVPPNQVEALLRVPTAGP